MSKNREIFWRVYVIYIVMVLVMLFVVFKVFSIQYGHELSRFVNEDGEVPTRLDSISPIRGSILSEEGKTIAVTIPYYEIRLDTKVASDDVFDDNVDSLAYYLSKEFAGKSKSHWEEKLRTARAEKKQYLFIKNKIKHDQLNRVKEFPIFRLPRNKGGLIINRDVKRILPFGKLAARTIGYDRDGIQPVGLEGAYLNYLRGEHGLQLKKKVGNGWKSQENEYEKDPVDGSDVHTSINISMQNVAEGELLRQLKTQEAKHGSVVVMEVETGFVKAIANLSIGSDGDYHETFNHAIGTATEPGSTFKLASLIALLEDDKLDITDTVKAYGKYEFYGETLHDSRASGYGKISLKRAFEVSSNVFSKLIHNAYKENPQRFVDKLHSLGLNEKLGLPIAGEARPLIRNAGDEGWSGLSLAWMSIGYESKLAPIQVLALYNAVANDGMLMQPQFVESIQKNGKTIQTFLPNILNPRICSRSTLEKVQKCLEGVVENGTGKLLKGHDLKIAGKTGTAKLAKGNTGYGGTGETEYQASFVGYFPADNPKYSCIVTIAGPTKQIYGAQVSGTVFKAIADKVYATSLKYHDHINKKENRVESLPAVKVSKSEEIQNLLSKVNTPYSTDKSGADWVETKKGEKLQINRRYIGDTTVPNVYGMGLNDALYLLENRGIKVKISGKGKVISQSIKAGTPIIKGSRITLELGL